MSTTERGMITLLKIARARLWIAIGCQPTHRHAKGDHPSFLYAKAVATSGDA